VPAGALALEMRPLRLRIERLVVRRLLRARRARLNADPARRAVVGRDLDRHQLPGEIAAASLFRAEAVRRPLERGRIVDLHADRRVRADERALRAVDA